MLEFQGCETVANHTRFLCLGLLRFAFGVAFVGCFAHSLVSFCFRESTRRRVEVIKSVV